MGLDLAKTHGWILSELQRDRSISESMGSLMDHCEAALPHSDWSQLRSLPYGDPTPLVEWIQRPFLDEPPARPLCGLWFGLFNPCPDGRTPTADIYVCGSERFDPNPSDNLWAVGPDWWPDARYARSELLANIYRIAYRQDAREMDRSGGLGVDAEFALCLGYGVFAVRKLLGQVAPSLILGESDLLGAAVGFDNGDFVLRGKMTRDGLAALDRSDQVSLGLRLAQLLESLRSCDSKTVLLAVMASEGLGDRARETVPDLVRIASTFEHAAVRQVAVYALAAIASDDRHAKVAVLQALKDTSALVRREALQALISIKDLSPDDLALIKNMETDSDRHVARWSEITLRNIRSRTEAN